MGLAHINKEEIDVVAPELVIEFIDSLNRTGSHRTGGRAENQQDVLLTLIVAQAQGIALQGLAFKIRGMLAGLRSREGRASGIVQMLPGEMFVVVVAESQHVDASIRDYSTLSPFGSMPAMLSPFSRRGRAFKK